MASAPRRCDRGDAVERAGADSRPRAGAAARPRPAGGRVRSRRPRPEAPPRPTARGRSARCSRTSASSPASGTCGCRRRCGPSGCRRGFRLAAVSDEELVDALQWARSTMRASVAGARPPRAVYRRAGRPCRPVWDADRVPRPGRRQPHRLLVPGVPALALAAADPFPARAQGYPRGMTATTLALPARYRGTELIALGRHGRRLRGDR